jgi:nucleoside-diphosphate-sugar epimerase
MKVLITGANGFIGQALFQALQSNDIAVRAAVRDATTSRLACSTPSEVVAIGDIGPKTDWSLCLNGVYCVVHCAARAHVMHETEADGLTVYRGVNVHGTRSLAEQAARSGVRRLVFLSSIGVNGMATDEAGRFAYDDTPQPHDSYTVSKWEAEQVLMEVAEKTGLEVVVVRSPLVYGPGVKGNFLRLLQLVSRGIWLPLGVVRNKRSLVGLDNLIDVLVRCIDHPNAPGSIFLVSDGHDISTPALIQALARAMNKPARLLPVPLWMMRLAGRVTGKSNELKRLTGSLRVDINHTRETLGWSPPVSVDEGLKKTVEWYKSTC